MDPALQPDLIRRAHAARLRVAAHIETAADFRAATLAAVDDIAHLPFYDDSIGASRYLLTPADARLAASRGIRVTTTICWSAADGAADTTAARQRARDVVRANLRTLRQAGVELLVGSDKFRNTSVAEAAALRATGVFTSAELLHMWTEVTPRAIFPGRRIGRLADGYEATILVLDGDPIRDFDNTGHIRIRMKQGTLLTPIVSDAQLPPLPGS
jgi:imidazolonepropionase-like amidohydrolase